MEKKLLFCLIFALVFIIISVVLWAIKKMALLTITAIIAGIFLTRGGLIYLAIDYVEPVVTELKQDVEELEVPKPELKLELPKLEYMEKEGPGFGLDAIKGESNYSTGIGEAIVDKITGELVDE